MRRLREEIDSPDPTLARAAALLSTMPPLETERLRRRPPIARVVAPVRMRRLRVALVVVVTTVSAAAAASTLHARWSRAHNAAAQAPLPSAPESALRSRPSRSGAHGVAEAPDPADRSEPPAVDDDRSIPAGSLPSVPSRHSGPSRGPVREPAHGLATAAEEDESALMVAAVRALRRDGDASRAEQLAEQALQRYPHGRQVEEAMDLAMEAAFARGDASDARRAAQRYLSSFRAGRFADRALRILATPDR